MELPDDPPGLYKCHICVRQFGRKSNMTRHLKVHAEPQFKCPDCEQAFNLKQHLDRHRKQHLYPVIPLYKTKPKVAQLAATDIASEAERNPIKLNDIDRVWLSPHTAEKRAKQLGGEFWQPCVVLTFGKYQGHTFKWLLENAVGWTCWLCSEYVLKDEKHDQLLKWQKKTLLDFCMGFQLIMEEIDKRILKSKKKASLSEVEYKPGNKKPDNTSSTASASLDETPDEFSEEYLKDAELLAAADEELVRSHVHVETTLTTVGKLIQSCKKSTSQSQNLQTLPEIDQSTSDSQVQPSTSHVQVSGTGTCSDKTVFEGWHRSWEVATTHGNITPNLRWMKDNVEHGLFLPAKPFKNKYGDYVDRKVLKDRMEFNPPPLPSSMMGSIPNMLTFFTTPVFFRRPVGVMKVKVKCPNSNCPAPDSYLIRKGYGSTARQVCGLHSYYTLLTERLFCIPCSNLRQRSSHSALQDSDSEEEDTQSGQQYSFLAHSPRILMSLSPAVRSMFQAVICGKRTIDKNVVTLLDDKINSVSMTKVQRLVQQGHDKWYIERRDLYQTLLFEAQTAKGSSVSQPGILQYVRPSGTYTPPIPKPSLPSARVLRRAHLLLEMEKMPVYIASILSVTGKILCIDGTKQVLKKISGDGQGTMQYVTSILNEWGQFLTTVVVASESEGSYRRLARGLVSRFKRAGAPAPKIMYADNNCCRNGSSSFLEVLFHDWVDEGMVVRLDIRHWLHRWDKVIIKQTHSKYGAFMSAMAGAVLAYNRDDMMQLVLAVRSGNVELYSAYSDEQMIHFLKPWQLKSYVRRVTRGVEETASTIEYILEEFKGPAGLDIDGIPLFKSHEAVDDHWRNQASKHLSCMQDPPGIQLYVATKVVVINGVRLNKYRCRRGSNSLEGLHAHLNSAIPSQCGIVPFQVYLIAFAVQWNSRMESLRVAGGKGRVSSCSDPRLIQRLNQQSEVLFGKEHIFEPNFVAPMPYPDQYDNEDEEELLGVQYAQCQSTSFTSKDYYVDRVEEEQANEDEGDDDNEDEDEGVSMEEGEEIPSDPIDDVNSAFAVLTEAEQVTETDSPALQDVLAPSHLHLPGFEEVEALALALLKLTDNGDQHIVSAADRQRILSCFDKLKDHDRSVRKFIKNYESKWGYTLFGRCLGPDSPENSAAQKTKFAKRYAPAMQITEDSRLLYLLIKMIRNRPPASVVHSPSKQAIAMKSLYKRIVDRVSDDPTLSGLNLPLPNLNAKSISTFLTRQDQKANNSSTQLPKCKPRQSVLSDATLPDAIHLPHTLTATHDEVQYTVQPHLSGKRHLEKRRLDFEDPTVCKVKPPATLAAVPVLIRPRPCVSTDKAPVLLVTPSQPQGPSVSFDQTSFVLAPPPKPLTATRCIPNKTRKPCAACGIAQCGGLRKRYTITVDGKKRMFTFCPTTCKSTTDGYDDRHYDDYEHFKKVVNERLAKNQ